MYCSPEQRLWPRPSRRLPTSHASRGLVACLGGGGADSAGGVIVLTTLSRRRSTDLSERSSGLGGPVCSPTRSSARSLLQGSVGCHLSWAPRPRGTPSPRLGSSSLDLMSVRSLELPTLCLLWRTTFRKRL